jgi:hypothetical protein
MGPGFWGSKTGAVLRTIVLIISILLLTWFVTSR